MLFGSLGGDVKVLKPFMFTIYIQHISAMRSDSVNLNNLLKIYHFKSLLPVETFGPSYTKNIFLYAFIFPVKWNGKKRQF